MPGNAALEERSACGLKALLQGSLQRLWAPDCEAMMGRPGDECTHLGENIGDQETINQNGALCTSSVMTRLCSQIAFGMSHLFLHGWR